MTQVSIKRDYQKFIILSTPRSGSQNLVYFLNSHANVLSYSEPFQPYFNLGNPEKTLFENPLFFHMYKHLRSKIPLYFLKRIIFKKYPPHISAVGFKIFYKQARLGKLRSVWTYLKNLQGLRVIHLKRENLLKSLVSYEIGIRTHEWMKFNSSPSPVIHLNLSPKRCVSYFQNIEQYQSTLDNYFSKKPILQLSYEHFIQEQNLESKRIQNFLGLSFEPLHSPLIKQNTHHLQDTVSNYAILKKYFSNSRWARFFD